MGFPTVEMTGEGTFAVVAMASLSATLPLSEPEEESTAEEACQKTSERGGGETSRDVKRRERTQHTPAKRDENKRR